MTTTHSVVSLILLISVDEINLSDNINHSRDSRTCVFVFVFNYRISRSIVAVDVKS